MDDGTAAPDEFVLCSSSVLLAVRDVIAVLMLSGLTALLI